MIKLKLIFILAFTMSSFSNLNPLFSEEIGFQLERRDKIFAIHHINNKVCWAVGDYGLILKTIDGGKTWDYRNYNTNLPLNDIFFIKNKGWIVGGDGLILDTEDGGFSWKKQQKINEVSLMKVFFLDEYRGFAIGENGTILSTKSGGRLWDYYPLDWSTILSEDLILGGIVSPNLYDIFFINRTNGWIVGDNGIVLKSSDGGEHWELVRIGFYPPLFSVFFKNESEGWVTGQNGLILHTDDRGKSWSELKVPSKASLFKILIANKFGLVVGAQGTALQTSDGGVTWSPLQLRILPPFPHFADAWIVSNSSPWKVLFIGGRIVKTTVFTH